MSSLDFRPLTDASGAAIPRTSFVSQRISGGLILTLVIGLVVGLFAAVLVQVVRGIAAGSGQDVGGAGWVIATVVFTAIPILSLAGFVVLIVVQFRTVPDLSVRLPAFATANRMRYTTSTANPDYPGAIFHYGIRPVASNRVTSTEGRFVDVGTLTYGMAAGETTTYRQWGYIAIRLDRRLPHMLMESTEFGPNSAGALPIMIDRSQVLSLEGDFDRYFTLYCPADYETDALYIFAPDLMALLVDEVGDFHVEIIDDWLFVYAPDSFAGADVAAYERIFRIVDVLSAKALRQTRAYEDDRSATPGFVATAGARMAQGPSRYSRDFWIACGGIAGICVLFTIGIFVALAIFRPLG